MPSLVAFGRSWTIASDDFVFPALTEAVVRFTWLSAACFLFALNSPVRCPSWDFVVYIFVLFTLNVLTLFVCVALSWVSSRGVILEPRPRRHVSTLLYLRVPLFVLEVICTFISTVLAFESGDLCHFGFGVRLSVVLQWLLVLSVFFGVLLVFNPAGDTHQRVDVSRERRTWSRRLHLCAIGQDQSMRDALDDIAALMASFFADVDLVASDVLAGLFLYLHSPREQHVLRPLVEQSPTPAWMTVANARRMMEFATAVYGWPAYCLNNCGCSAWCLLCKHLHCCSSCRCDRVMIVSDNCCSCGSAAFIAISKCAPADVVFMSFRNRLYQVPFAVLLDPLTKNIVVCIRGSASLMDLVTDLSLDDDAFSVDVDSDPILKHDGNFDHPDQEVRVHRGMLRSARYVLETLREFNLLEELRQLYPEFGLVVCGHSLGAGVATLLTLLLKQTYDSIRCFAFSPPGCVISESGLDVTRNYVMSIIVGDDLVPRMSYQAMRKLKLNIIDALLASNSAKYEVLIRGCFRLFFSYAWQTDEELGVDRHTSEVLLVRDRLPLIFRNSLSAANEYGGTENPDSDAASILRKNRIRLLPPGRILYLCVEGNTVNSKWISNSSLNEIELSGAMIRDHMPYYVRKVLLMESALSVS